MTTIPLSVIEKQASEAADILINDGDAELGYFTLLALLDKLSTASFPELTIVLTTDPDDDEPITEFACPHCELQTDELTAVDGSMRWTNSESLDGANRTVEFIYDETEDYHGVTYICAGCNRPVSLPEGWAEV
jgi:hypothetical protein